LKSEFAMNAVQIKKLRMGASEFVSGSVSLPAQRLSGSSATAGENLVKSMRRRQVAIGTERLGHDAS
jgi:hypothetical protein